MFTMLIACKLTDRTLHFSWLLVNTKESLQAKVGYSLINLHESFEVEQD